MNLLRRYHNYIKYLQQIGEEWIMNYEIFIWMSHFFHEYTE